MQLLAREEYGLRCLLQVARSAGDPEGPPLPVAAVAQAEGLSAEYAAQLLRRLRLGGLVTSTRGISGGYRLARPPHTISVWDALAVLGSPLYDDGFCRQFAGHHTGTGNGGTGSGGNGNGCSGTDCRSDGDAGCVHDRDCSLRAVWQAVEGAARSVLERVHLDDLRRDEISAEAWLAVVSATQGDVKCPS